MFANAHFNYYLTFVVEKLRFLKRRWVSWDVWGMQKTALKCNHCDGFWNIRRYHRYTYFDQISPILTQVFELYFENLNIRPVLIFQADANIFRLTSARPVTPSFLFSTVHCLRENATKFCAAFWYLKKIFFLGGGGVAPKSQNFKIS